MDSNRVFVHLVDIPGSVYIAKDIVSRLFSSELIENSRVDLYCNYSPQSYSWLPKHDNLFVHYPSVQQSTFEMPTLNELKKVCDDLTEKTNILYLHHKGATQPYNPCISDWRELMLYFAVDKWKDCVQKLTEVDAVGVNYTEKPYPHFSGNIWWATSDYIKRLPEIRIPQGRMNDASQFDFKHYTHLAYSYRFDAEFWLGLAQPKTHSFHQSNINHYRERYVKDRYNK